MGSVYSLNTPLLVVSGIICLILLICAVTAGHLKERLNRNFLFILCVQILVITVDLVIYTINGGERPYTFALLTAMSFLSFAFGIVSGWFFTWYFYYFLKLKTTISKRTEFFFRIAYASCCINMIFTFASLFNGMYFYIDEANRFALGNIHFLSQVLGVLIIIINGGIIITHRKVFEKREFMFLLSYIVLPVIAFITLNMNHGLRSTFDVATTLTILVFYIGIQKDIQSVLKQNELNARVAIMLTQIQPHFLHNALSAIAHLCDEDPEKAKKATTDFSIYLRGNMDSLSNRDFISFKKELTHVKGYLDLESAIYDSALTVVYDIESTDFLLPPLTIQPIVENAVKHGIGKTENGGTITISVRETEAEHIVTVADDGIGFDVNNPPQKNREQIGIENVKRRLAEQCRGTIEIISEPGEGTTVTIRLPK